MHSGIAKPTIIAITDYGIVMLVVCYGMLLHATLFWCNTCNSCQNNVSAEQPQNNSFEGPIEFNGDAVLLLVRY